MVSLAIFTAVSTPPIRRSSICWKRKESAGASTRKIRRTVALKPTGSTIRPEPMIMFGNTSKFPACEEGSRLTGCDSPLMSYDSVTSNLDRLAKIKNFTMFETDLNNNQLPQWMFITPNMSTFLFGVSVSDTNSLQQMTAMIRQLPPQEHGQDPSSLPY